MQSPNDIQALRDQIAQLQSRVETLEAAVHHDHELLEKDHKLLERIGSNASSQQEPGGISPVGL